MSNRDITQTLLQYKADTETVHRKGPNPLYWKNQTSFLQKIPSES